MKVLLGTAYFASHRGGIEIVAGRLASELQRAGDDVTWLACDATPPPPADAGCGEPLVVGASNITERRLGFPLPLPGPGALARIWRAVRSADALLLHDALYPTNVAAMLAAGWYRKPVVLVQHIAVVPYRSLLLRTLMTVANAIVARPMLAAADQVVFISETVCRHFSGLRFKAQPQVIFNGVDTGVFRLPPGDFDKAAARSALGLPVNGETVLFVGRFVEKKGLHIVERLARRQPDRNFVLAGWGPIDPRAWGLANVHVVSGLEGRSLVPLYQSADALLLPSIGEGLPLVMQEALACGLAVVCGAETATADPDLATVVDGVAIDATDPAGTSEAFGRALDRVLAEGRDALGGDRARARHDYVLARYSWAEAAAAYRAMLRSLVQPGEVPVATPVARAR